MVLATLPRTSEGRDPGDVPALRCLAAETGAGTVTTPWDALTATAAEFEAFAPATALTIRETLRRVEAALSAWWNEPLSVAEAARWGGYSESQLRRLVRERKLLLAPGGGIRRRHVPVHPGHEIPLGVEPGAVAAGDFLENIVNRRARARQGSR